MFGTVMRVRLRQGKTIDDLRAVMGPSWDEAAAHGGVWAEFGVDDKDPQIVIGVVHFTDRKAYLANADRPETDVQFRRMRELLESDPEWTDVAWVAMAGTPQVLSPV